jgi:hypothetical protein
MLVSKIRKNFQMLVIMFKTWTMVSILGQERDNIYSSALKRRTLRNENSKY